MAISVETIATTKSRKNVIRNFHLVKNVTYQDDVHFDTFPASHNRQIKLNAQIFGYYFRLLRYLARQDNAYFKEMCRVKQTSY